MEQNKVKYRCELCKVQFCIIRLCRSNLFTTLIDMLATLIHSTLAEGGDDNNRKHYQNLMKKLKKEIGDRHGPSVQSVRQLLPLSKNTIIEVLDLS